MKETLFFKKKITNEPQQQQDDNLKIIPFFHWYTSSNLSNGIYYIH